MVTKLRQPTLTIALVLIATSSICQYVFGDEPLFARPAAIAVSSDGAHAFIANKHGSWMTVIDTVTEQTRSVRGKWNGLVDLIWSSKSNLLLAIASSPPQIHEVDARPTDASEMRSYSIPGIPAHIAISLDGRFVCITLTWNHAVFVMELQEGRLAKNNLGKVLSLDFQPGHVLALDNELFLVADAFGGHLAVIDAESAKVTATQKILGHHIGGLARNDLSKTIAITHQRLSSIAQTNRDDIHWGALMQNLVTAIPESQLIVPNADTAKFMKKLPLGEVGNGAADPCGIVSWDDWLCVAITGTNQFAFLDSITGRFQYLPLEQPPARLIRLGESKVLWISTLGDTAGILERVGRRFEKRGHFGSARTLSTPEDRGEVAFYSGQLSHDGWMSCSSCHTNVHSPDLLADTMGDRRYDNPKRIPSLFNVAKTGPWTWNGSEASLEGQIAKTLSTTMHRDQNPQTTEDNSSVAKNIAAFLSKQRLPNSDRMESPHRIRGQNLFEKRRCNHCHQPESHYTSSDTFDVGVVDEAGERKFNPPSLEGLAYRKAFFHDGRYRSIEEVLRFHPEAKRPMTQDEIAYLSLFLRSL